MPSSPDRRITATFCAAALLAACATPSPNDTPPSQSASLAASREANRPGRTPKGPAANISPAQALAPQAQGQRVKWTGGINAIDTREPGRQCFTLLHATSDAQGVLQWPRDEQQFVACGAGYYDSKLVTQFTLASFEGRVAGQQTVLNKPVPVIEIEALYRFSDCTQGSENSPECYSGYLQPQKP